MKKASVLFLAAVMLLSLLAACGDGPDGSFDWIDPPQAEQKNDSLTIYSLNVGRPYLLERAVTFFRAKHPGVKIELILEDYNEAQGYESYEKTAAEVMAGKGPDILIINNITDVEKLVRQGVFADMEPFFEADGFDWTPYNQAVMDGGVWDGRRYMIPLSYSFPLLFSTRSALEKADFNVDACGNFKGFLDETTRYMEDPAHTSTPFFMSFLVAQPAAYAGIAMAGYNTGQVDLSSPDLKAGLQWMKTLNERFPAPVFGYGGVEGAAAVRDGEALWTISFDAGQGFYWQYGALKTVGEAVMMPIRDLNGGIQAQLEYPLGVRANSENLQNAYDFIKILLSKEVQSLPGSPVGMCLSVLNEAMYDFYKKPTNSPTQFGWLKRGEQGFTSTMNDYDATDYPTEEEFEQFMGYTREISGTYYSGTVDAYIYGAMRPFLYEGMDYNEALENAQRTLEIRISE